MINGLALRYATGSERPCRQDVQDFEDLQDLNVHAQEHLVDPADRVYPYVLSIIHCPDAIQRPSASLL